MGGVDINHYDNDYQLPKIILSIVCANLAWQYAPFTKKDKKIAKNLKGGI